LNEEEIMTIENRHLTKSYYKFPINIIEGKGAVLQDVNGRKYIDCMGGYGISILGHGHPKIVEAIQEQAARLITCHGSLYNDKRSELLEKLVKIAPEGINKIFFCNSGSESVECGLKLALKYTGKTQIVSMIRGYHGKTLGSLSVTWNRKYRDSFRQFLIPNTKFVPFGKINKAKEAISEKTAAVIVEPIQGESGIYVAPEGFLQNLRELCDRNETLLIFDEVQTGFGRTGKMWASQHFEVIPDIMCIAKGMAGGIPMGATLAKSEIMNSLGIGEHTTTFGGNPLASAAACATIDVIIKEKLIDRAQMLGNYFKKRLTKIQEKFRIVRDVRGLGLMIGLESRFEIKNILLSSLDRGVIVLYSGKNILRFLPPLVIEKYQIDKVVEVLEELFEEEEKLRIGKRPVT
jgi:acetylornithine/LysW-gamma-L-lysine aminotransferase